MDKYRPCSDLGGESCEYTKRLKGELDNLVHLLKPIMPSQQAMPHLKGMDVHAESIPLHELGGDQVAFFDYAEQFSEFGNASDKIGILLSDSAGHQTTTACLSSSFYYAISLGIMYELERNGEVTVNLLDRLNHVYHNTFGVFLTTFFGELSEEGVLRYELAGHPAPLVFSNEFNRFQLLGTEQLARSLPVGMAPTYDSQAIVTQRHKTNQIALTQKGDIIIVHSDGLEDHFRDDEAYFPNLLEEVVRATKHLPARDIAHAIREDLLSFAECEDDISYVVMKKV